MERTALERFKRQAQGALRAEADQASEQLLGEVTHARDDIFRLVETSRVAYGASMPRLVDHLQLVANQLGDVEDMLLTRPGAGLRDPVDAIPRLPRLRRLRHRRAG